MTELATALTGSQIIPQGHLPLDPFEGFAGLFAALFGCGRKPGLGFRKIAQPNSTFDGQRGAQQLVWHISVKAGALQILQIFSTSHVGHFP